MSDARRIVLAEPALQAGGSSAVVNFTLDANTDFLEWRFQMPEAGTITRVGVLYGARTGTPPEFIASLQGDDGTGIPDGVIKGGVNPAKQEFTPPADTTWDGTWREITLDNTYAAVRGENLFLRLGYSSGTIDASNKSSFTSYVFSSGFGLPYVIENNAGVRTRQSGMPVFAIGTASKWYGYPLESVYTGAFNSGTTPDEQGIRFVLDAAWGATFKLIGARFTRVSLTASGTSKLILYDTDGTTVLQDVTFDHDAIQANGSYRQMDVYFDEASLTALNFGSVYRLAIQPQGAVSVQLVGLAQDLNEYLTAFPGGTSWHRTHRVDAGAWTDDDKTCMFMAPILDDWTEQSAGTQIIRATRRVL